MTANNLQDKFQAWLVGVTLKNVAVSKQCPSALVLGSCPLSRQWGWRKRDSTPGQPQPQPVPTARRRGAVPEMQEAPMNALTNIPPHLHDAAKRIQEDPELFHEMCRIGCCLACILNMHGFADSNMYKSNSLAELGNNFGVTTSIDNCISCIGILQSACWITEQHLPSSKRTDGSPDIASQSTAVQQSTSPLRKIAEAVEEGNYEFNDFTLNLQFPVSLAIRRHAVCEYLKDKVPRGRPLGENTSLLKDITKALYQKGVENILRQKVTFHKSSDFRILLTWECPSTEDETKLIGSVDHKRDPGGKSKQKKQRVQLMSQATVMKVLPIIPTKAFRDYGHWPPVAMPDAQLKVSLSMEPFLIGGRYVKLGRGLSQTPWEIDGSRKGESSVEEEISRSILPHFKAAEHRFHSSGREDIDVRMLGGGRPFVLEFVDPHRLPKTEPNYWESIEKTVNASSSLVRIESLRPFSKTDFDALKDGVDKKRKTYR